MTALPLLLTKLALPPARPDLIQRGALQTRLTAAADVRLLLVSAPAGFGKTTCLMQWCGQLRDQGKTIAWYSLDDSDNDPARFAAYVVEALAQAIQPPEIAAIRDQNSGQIENTFTLLINALLAAAQPCVLVLDDYHTITAQAIHTAIGLLIERLPPFVQVAIGSRADPPLQLSRLRARHQLVEIRAADLRFSGKEVQTFFQAALNQPLSEETTAALEAGTEGWAAGLQMIALLAQHRQPAGNLNLAAVTEQITGSQRHIFEYFADEVFEQQSTDIQHFLLETAPLATLNADLCAAITGRTDAARVLEQLDRANLFIMPLNVERSWYRYHHLLRDFLRGRLQQTAPERFPELHRRAGEWYLRQGYNIEAIHHLLAAADYEYAARLIEQGIGRALINQGEFVTLAGWQQHFPESVLHTHPQFCLMLSLALFFTGQWQQADGLLHAAEQSLQANSGKSTQTDSLRATLTAYRIFNLCETGHVRQAEMLLQTVWEQLAPSDEGIQATLLSAQASVCAAAGDVLGTAAATRQCRDIAQRRQNQLLWQISSARLAVYLIILGQLREAEAICRDALQTDATSPAASDIHFVLGQIHYEHDQLDAAETAIQTGLELVGKGGQVYALRYAYTLLAWIKQAQAQDETAAEAMQRALQLARSYNLPRTVQEMQAWQTQLWLQQNQPEPARKWAEVYRRQSPTEAAHEVEDLMLARVWLAAGQIADALTLLDKLLISAQAGERHRRVIEIQLLQALAWQQSGNRQFALEALKHALTLAEPEGYRRVFLAEGKPLFALLREAREQKANATFIDRLLAEAGISSQAMVSAPDDLTERELEVLRLLARGASNQDIAESLVISLGTVKAHTNHILGKLSARNRTEAVARARAKGLLGD